MKRLAHKLLLHLPSRNRRRQWKYVSPRRRVIGLLVLALILLLLYAGWYLTHDSRIRRQAKLALEGLTGADVDVDAAEFSFFEGIRLQNVRVRIRGDNAPFPFFTAREVVLRYDPLSLLTQRTIRPTEIVCIDPVVNLEHNEDTGESNAERLFRMAAARSDGPAVDTLPTIQLTNGLLRSRVKQGRQRSTITEERIDCTFRPTAPDRYEVTVRGPHTNVIWAKSLLDLNTGRLTVEEFVGTSRLFMILPPRYHDWLQRYEVTGDFELLDEGYTDPDRDRYEIALRGFSLRLPEGEGDLTLQNVTGRLRFSPEGVVLDDVRGLVPQAGGARFELQGEYRGLKQDSPFLVTVTIHDFALPESASGELGQVVDFLRRRFEPEGKATLTLSYQRRADGDVDIVGEIQPRGMTMTPDWFPLTVQNVTGRVTFDEEENYTLDLNLERPGGANGLRGQLRATGTITHPGPQRRSVYDLTVRGTDVPLDKDLRAALPQRFHAIWDRFSPAGVSDARVRVHKPAPDEPMDIELDLLLRGKASARYKNFPYPLTNLTGRIELRGDTVTIPLIESERGKTFVRIKGTVTGLASDETTTDVDIDAQRVALDDALIAALPDEARKFVENFSVSGQARDATAKITQQPGQDTAYHLTAALADVAFASKTFAYPVQGARGTLVVTPEGIEIRELTGEHDDATVQVDATLDTGVEAPSYLVTLQGKNVLLNQDFHDALPRNVQDTWASLRPGGRVDIRLDLADRDGDGEVDEDYRLVLQAREMSMQSRDFPYPFRGITGRAIVTPGRVVLQGMQARHGRMSATLSGTIKTEGERHEMVLQASIKEMSIDKELLDAVPADIVPLVKRFREGGRLNAEISKLAIVRQPVVRTESDEEPAKLSDAKPAQASPTASEVQWVAEGSLAFRDIDFDLGFGGRKLTGLVNGKVGQKDGQLGMNANVELQTIELGDRTIRNVRGQILKLPGSDVLRIDKIEGQAHDGVIVGQASIRLADPVTYKLSMEFEDVDLAKLFNAGEADPQKWVDVKGTVAGPLVFSARGGKTPTRQAVGELVIRDAKLYELPVILGALQIIYLQLPGEGAFNSGTVKYALRDNTLTFEEIYLTGKSISVLGSGTYDLKDDQLKVTFLTGPPGKLQRLDELTEDVLQALSSTLVEIRVSGPLKRPKMDTVPLSPLDTILRRLLAPSLQPQ